MDKDHRELVQRLFTRATEILEDAAETAVAGQAATRPVKKYACYANTLIAAADELDSVARLIKALTVERHYHCND